MAEFTLFGTEGCHLCEEAEQLLVQAGLAFDKQDIIDDEQAQQRYAIRIPVLLYQKGGFELDWPFDTQQILDFEKHCFRA
jgi:hypothetical protein